MLPIRLPQAEIQRLAAASAGGAPVTVDLEQCVVRAPDGVVTPFTIDALRREGLLKGLDDIGLTLQAESAIRVWQREDRLRRPWAWASVSPPRP